MLLFASFDVEDWEFAASSLPSSTPTKGMDPSLLFFLVVLSLLLFGSFDVEDCVFVASSLPSSAPIESLGCKSSVEVLASVKSGLPLCSLQ